MLTNHVQSVLRSSPRGGVTLLSHIITAGSDPIKVPNIGWVGEIGDYQNTSK